MNGGVDHIIGETYHGRKGRVQNSFRYSVDYVLLDAEAKLDTPALFARNAAGLTSLHDVDHGGTPKQGRGPAWVRDVLAHYGIGDITQVQLLTQPRVLGHVFNPVSFWLCRSADGALRATIAEVNNTFGDRHSYLCHHPDLRPISASDQLQSKKLMHVSPFQPIEGGYTFRFDVTEARIGIWIDYGREGGGILATLTGKRQPLTSASILRSMVRRPLGARRVLALIHWQALKLWIKGASFRSQPEAPQDEVSKG